jgi:hypothetical protein
VISAIATSSTIAGGKERAALILQAQFHRVRHVFCGDIGKHLLLHQLFQHPVEQDLRRQFLVLRRAASRASRSGGRR